MNTRLSSKWAKINIFFIGIFYLMSGIWECLIGLTQMESTPTGIYFLLDLYRGYTTIIGHITILTGLGLLLGIFFRINLVRVLAIILASWNLFTSPLIEIWWNLYSILIKKFLVTDSWLSLWGHSFILILIYSSVRFYIIYILRVYKAGYIFLKEKRP